jgi:hypothetical protein
MPDSTLTSNDFAHPSSGAIAQPVLKSMFQECKGQVTVLPKTIP